MSELDRRSVLVGVGAAAAVTAFDPIVGKSVAHASVPTVGTQAPAFYRVKLGDFEITQVADGARTFPMPDGFVKNVTKEEALAAAEAAYMPKGMVTVPFNPIVINTGSKSILIDAGYGPATLPAAG